MIEKISSKIASHICTNMHTSDSELNYEIIEYGIECILNTLIPIMFFVVYSLFHKIFLEMIIWLFIFLIYRNLIGGYHASSHLKCILLSTVYGFMSLYAILLASHLCIQSKVFSILLLFTIHIFAKPIIHHIEDHSSAYIKQCKIKISITLLLSCLLIIIFHHVLPCVSNSIFIGIISAEFLYAIALPQYSPGF